MKALLGFVAGFIVAIGFSGEAMDAFFEGGQCRFRTAEDGTFYQADRHTDNYMRPACFSFGVADKLKGNFGYRLAFVGTGSIQARDNMAVNDETRYHYKGACALPSSEAGCPVRFNGAGDTYGISASFTYEQPLYGRLSAIAEAGLFYFQHHFKSEAQFVPCCNRQISYNETSNIWDQPSPLAGLTLKYRAVYLAARHYWPSDHRPLSLTNHSFWQLSAGVEKRFDL